VLTKPESCKGCPLYQDGKGFVPDRIVDGTEVLILAQNPGAHEESGEQVVGHTYVGRKRVPVVQPNPDGPAPLIGQTGHDMTTEYLPLTGLSREAVSTANVLKCRLIVNGKRTNDLPTGRTLTDAVDHCTRAHLKIPPTIRFVVAMGALATKFTGCPGSVSSWRGFTYEWTP
jgi:uracil-DNA glycosylase